jgi:hypothetical protein
MRGRLSSSRGVIGHQDVGMDAAEIASRRLGQPVAVSGIILDGEEDGAAIVAALDDVQRLVGEEIAAEPGHRRPLG